MIIEMLAPIFIVVGYISYFLSRLLGLRGFKCCAFKSWKPKSSASNLIKPVAFALFLE